MALTGAGVRLTGDTNASSLRGTAMSIILDLEPEIERGLLARAAAKGVSLADYAQEILAREVGAPGNLVSKPGVSEAKNLVELFENSPFKGLDMEFERDKDYGREIEL
jgi:hypothetical protein